MPKISKRFAVAAAKVEDRTYVIMALTPGWIFANLRDVNSRDLFNQCGEPIPGALLALNR